MSKPRNVLSLEEVVIGSDLLTFLPITLEADVSSSIWGQKMTPALETFVSFMTLGPRTRTSGAWAGLGSFMYRRLTWAATVTKSQWALAPARPAWRWEGDGAGRHSTVLGSCAPLTPATLLLRSPSPLFLLCTHPHPLLSTKGVIDPEKAELTNILNDDTL